LGIDIEFVDVAGFDRRGAIVVRREWQYSEVKTAAHRNAAAWGLSAPSMGSRGRNGIPEPFRSFANLSAGGAAPWSAPGSVPNSCDIPAWAADLTAGYGDKLEGSPVIWSIIFAGVRWLSRRLHDSRHCYQ
jgi:hypothetical protein